jgi:hypothetical protein
MPREDRRVLNIKQDSINEIDYYPSSQTVADGDMVISHPKGKTLRLYKKLKGMLWWNDFTKDGNQTVEKNLEVKGKINDISMGTSAVPDGGIGFAKFAMSGTTTNADGPHVQYTTSADSYPVFQQLNWGHDNISLNFDAYYDGAWKSSDAGSNFQFYKIGDIFKLMYDSGIAQGSAVTWNNGITLNTSGQAGIGTASPDDALHVKGNIFIEDASPEITFETGAGKYNWQIAAQENTDQAFEIGLGSADDDASNDTFSPKLTIESSGDVGIGVTNPAHKIDVVGTAGLSTGTAWTNTSDVRIKTNVETVTGGLDKINQLRPVSFNYISDYADIHQEIDASKKYNSFIANEYAEVFPDAVSVGGNLERITPSSDIGEPNEVEVLIEDLLQFTPHDLHVYLVKAVQELSAKVTALENK